MINRSQAYILENRQSSTDPSSQLLEYLPAMQHLFSSPCTLQYLPSFLLHLLQVDSLQLPLGTSTTLLLSYGAECPMGSSNLQTSALYALGTTSFSSIGVFLGIQDF